MFQHLSVTAIAAMIAAIASRWVARCAHIALSLSVPVLVVLFAGIAQAEPPKLVSYGSFDAHTASPVGVAVDQSSHDVYVAGLIDRGNPFAGVPVNEFDASGTLLTPPSPFAQGYHAGVAVNPTNGDLYVLGNAFSAFGPPVLETYDPTSGTLISSFSLPEIDNDEPFTVVQIAADSTGDVYVPVSPANEVLEYSPGGTLLHTFTGGEGALSKPTGVAVDSSGNVWVADAGNNRIEELSSSDSSIRTISSEGVHAVALDGHGNVFAAVENAVDPCGSFISPCPHVVEYGSTGLQVADIGAGSFGSVHEESLPPSMLAVDEASGRVYVANPAGFVLIYGQPKAPTIGRELTAEVGTSEAKLGALVSAGGIPTTYRFEYDTREYSEGEGPHGQSTPFPEGNVGEGVTLHTVWASAIGLAPGTTYHYRVVASNELGTVVGADHAFTTETADRAACANEQFRGGFSAMLPDCRAYELVVPPASNSSQPGQAESPAVDGNAIPFETREPLPGAGAGGDYYRAARGTDGWSSEDVIPLESYTGILCNNQAGKALVYSDGLSAAILELGELTRAGRAGSGACNAEGLEVVRAEPVGYANLLVRDNDTRTYRLVNAPPPGVTPADAHFKGASSDLSLVVFSELAPLTPDAPAGVEDLYEWDEGVLRLLTATGSLAVGQEGQNGKQAIAADGSHVLFTAGGGLYDRIGGERTVQVDESQGGPGASGGGRFWTASADGSRVLFTDESRLTADSTAMAGEPDLYQCVLSASSKCELTDLTVAKAGEPADVRAVSALGSHDSSHVYFIARGVLAGNRRAFTDAEGNSVVEEAKTSEPNLYLEQGGAITFVATLSEGDAGAGLVSPDGAWLAFQSTKSLTSYDNTVSGQSTQEVFLYDAAANQLTCASCNPSGEAPVGAETSLPTATQRPLSDGGRLLFDTREALVPSDTNEQVDVYEYENDQLSLISSGTSSTESKFDGASETGDNVFFTSTQPLVPQDTQEETLVIYDARVGGGFAAGSAPPPCATADSCRTPVAPQPSIYGAPASQTFSGSGNLVPPPLVKPKLLTKAQKLARALSSCRKRYKHSKKRRSSCERQAHRTYTPAKKAAGKAKSHKGGKES